MTDVELRDQLMTLLVAGHDTTATGLSWALERLTRHPRRLAQGSRAPHGPAQQAIPMGDEYLDAVAKEALRIRPVVFDVGRVLTEPVELAGYRLPAGVMVAPGIGLVHADRRIYPEPDRFDPDRMLGASLDPDDLAAVRWRQSALPRRDVRDVRNADRAARGAAPSRADATTAEGERQRVRASFWCRTAVPESRCRRSTSSTGGERDAQPPPARRPAARCRGRDQVDHPDRVAFAPLAGADELRSARPGFRCATAVLQIVQFGRAEAVRGVEDLAERRQLQQPGDEGRRAGAEMVDRSARRRGRRC